MNLRISSKIIGALSIMVVMMMVLGINAYINSRDSLSNVKKIEAGYYRAVTVSQIENELTAAALDMRRFITDQKEEYKASYEQRMVKVIDMGNQLVQYSEAQNKPEIEKLVDGTKRYRDGVLNSLIPLLKEQINPQLDPQAKSEVNKKLGAVVTELTALTQSNQQIVRSTVERESKTVVQEVDQSNRSSVVATNIALLLMGFSVIVGAVLSLVLRRTITKPVVALVQELNDMAAGDLSSKQNKSLDRTDEFGDIYAALQKSQQRVRNLVQIVQSQAEQLSAASEELNASADQAAQAANQVAVSITEVAEGAERQVKALDSTNDIVGKISGGIQNIAENANDAAEKSNKTAAVAKDGEKSIDAAVQQMTSIDKTVSKSAQVVAKLGDRSKEIGQIVGTISGIAGQTNLLALNAAIEAARAGEQGRGFAVVAEEVRKLAEQSQEAAKQIANLINEIQVDTEQAVEAMSLGTHEVKVGGEVIATAGKIFTGIVELVEQVSGQVRDISTAIQGMASGSQQIVAAVNDVDMLSKAASGEAQNVSAATEETSASMEEIASSSQSLTRMAQELQEAVGKFKV